MRSSGEGEGAEVGERADGGARVARPFAAASSNNGARGNAAPTWPHLYVSIAKAE